MKVSVVVVVVVVRGLATRDLAMIPFDIYKSSLTSEAVRNAVSFAWSASLALPRMPTSAANCEAIIEGANSTLQVSQLQVVVSMESASCCFAGYTPP